jgi:hypothetical protein
LRPTAASSSAEPGSTAAAATRKAAEEMSPGTSKLQAAGVAPPSTETARAVGSSWSVKNSTRTGTPNQRSIRSVWSRVKARVSETRVTPRAASPASRTQDLTCALATGIS